MSPARVGSEPGNEADKGLGFGLLRDPWERRTGAGVFGVGMFGNNKVGGDRFPDEVEVIGGGGETFAECLKRARSETETRRKAKLGRQGRGVAEALPACKKGRLGREVRRRPTAISQDEPPPPSAGPQPRARARAQTRPPAAASRASKPAPSAARTTPTTTTPRTSP